MAQWVRICLAIQETAVQSLVREDPHATEQQSPSATTAEPELRSLGATTPQAHGPRACAPQQETPPQ